MVDAVRRCDSRKFKPWVHERISELRQCSRGAHPPSAHVHHTLGAIVRA